MSYLTTGLIEAATGLKVEDHEELEEVEIIFDAVQVVCPREDDGGGLRRCSRLRRLSLVNCGLESIGTLAPVSATLERLSLCDQQLTSMQLGWLPQLRWLYLQENSISKIEGLDQLPKLKTLWLFSNKISSLNGILQECGELAELWLQENRISCLGSLQQEEETSSTKSGGGLSSLRELGLAGNRITEYRELCALGCLMNLKSLSLDDEHFGACPVTLKKGYREAAVRAIPRLTRLDGHDIEKKEREAADQGYLDAVAAFNARVDDLGLAHRRAIADAESHAQRLGKQSYDEHLVMAQSFRELEALVRDGRQALVSAHARQRSARAAALSQLEAGLASCKASLAKRLEKIQRQHAKRAAHEDAILEALERRVRAERCLALIVAELQYNETKQPFFFKLLGSHTPDFRFLASQLTAASSKLPDEQSEQPFVLVTAYRLAPDLKRMEARRDDELWYFCSGRDLEKVKGLFHLDSAQPFLLWSSAEAAANVALKNTLSEPTRFHEFSNVEDDAIQLLRAARHTLQTDTDDDDTHEELDPLALRLDDDIGHLALVALCRRPLSELETGAADSPEAALSAAHSSGHAVRCRETGSLALMAAEIQPEYLLLLASGLVAQDQRSLEAQLEEADDNTDQEDDLQEDPEQFLAKLVEHHTHCASADIDPRAAEILREADAYLSKREADLKCHRSNVQEYRLAQDATLRSSSSSSSQQATMMQATSSSSTRR